MELETTDLNTSSLLNDTIQHHFSQLAVGIVHEIRNPLTTIKGFLQLLKPYLKETGKEHYAELALSELNRANDLIYEFLNAAIPHSNSKQNTSLNKIIQEMILLFESEAILKNIQLSSTLSEQDITLPIPANQLKQVLMNLIKNAIEAIDENTIRSIHISTQIDIMSASFHITDSGCGMTDEARKNLFIPFHSSKEKGTGIGLCLCKKIIEDYGGVIHVESIPNKGTTFSIFLPYKE